MPHSGAPLEQVCGGAGPYQCGADLGPDVPEHSQLRPEGPANVSSEKAAQPQGSIASGSTAPGQHSPGASKPQGQDSLRAAQPRPQGRKHV